MTSSTRKRWQNPCLEEMKYSGAMGVHERVPYAQATERTARRPIVINVKKVDGRHRSTFVAKEFNNGTDQAMYAATPGSIEAVDSEARGT